MTSRRRCPQCNEWSCAPGCTERMDHIRSLAERLHELAPEAARPLMEWVNSQPTASERSGKTSPAVGHNATTKGEAPTVAAAAYASPRESGPDAASTSAPVARRDGRAPTETGAGGGSLAAETSSPERSA